MTDRSHPPSFLARQRGSTTEYDRKRPIFRNRQSNNSIYLETPNRLGAGVGRERWPRQKNTMGSRFHVRSGIYSVLSTQSKASAPVSQQFPAQWLRIITANGMNR